jgi:hypothetical protein
MKIRKSMSTLIRTAQYCHIELGCEMEYDSKTDDITSKDFIRRVDLASTRLDKRLAGYWNSLHSHVEEYYSGKIAEIKHDGKTKGSKTRS